MKINDRQLQIMFRVLEGSCNFIDRTDMNTFGFDRQTRINVYNEIINQQNKDLQEIKNEPKIDPTDKIIFLDTIEFVYGELAIQFGDTHSHYETIIRIMAGRLAARDKTNYDISLKEAKDIYEIFFNTWKAGHLKRDE